jgi:hypothetical protein
MDEVRKVIKTCYEEVWTMYHAAAAAAAAAVACTWNIDDLRLNRSRTPPAALSVFKRSGDSTSWGAWS